MRNYVRSYINSCLGYLYNKCPPGKQPGSFSTIEKEPIPMDTLHIDHLRPFVATARKNKFLILVVDGFTKFLFLKPASSTKTGPAMEFLREIIGSA